MAMSKTYASRSGRVDEGERTVDDKRSWLRFWGTYAVAFLLTVSIAIFLPGGPRRLGMSVTMFVWTYAILGFLAAAFAILGGLALFRTAR
jgi:hypothetical protein